MVITSFTLMNAAGDKQRAACPRPVNHINRIILMVIHTVTGVLPDV
ncbi:Uncharacterised protein [Vibrio cholerae]|nr:Uncharacterised protein [Vibrio cholerae]